MTGSSKNKALSAVWIPDYMLLHCIVFYITLRYTAKHWTVGIRPRRFGVGGHFIASVICPLTPGRRNPSYATVRACQFFIVASDDSCHASDTVSSALWSQTRKLLIEFLVVKTLLKSSSSRSKRKQKWSTKVKKLESKNVEQNARLKCFLTKYGGVMQDSMVVQKWIEMLTSCENA